VSERRLVLYVDCDPTTISRGVVLLRDLGHVVVATTGAELAVAIVAKEPVALVVICESLDPDLRPELVRKIGFLRKGIPVLLLSQQSRVNVYVGTEVKDCNGESLKEVLRRLVH
jgi:CheY-like chemotaxis protein